MKFKRLIRDTTIVALIREDGSTAHFQVDRLVDELESIVRKKYPNVPLVNAFALGIKNGDLLDLIRRV